MQPKMTTPATRPLDQSCTDQEIIRIAFEAKPTEWNVEDRPGSLMYHCHILEHREAGMMGHFEVVR